MHLSGTVFGGQQPISGGQIYLYAISGFGSGNASNSLLNTSGTGVAVGANGNGYVTTDANGGFDITGDYTCPSYNTNVETYLLAVGGNPGLAAGTNNTAITLLAALGPCANLPNIAFININEVSTVVGVTAIQQFMTDSTHVGAPPNLTGIQNAFSTVANLMNTASSGALAVTPNGNGSVPQAKIYTLANILAGCVNAAGPTSGGCPGLFAATTSASGTVPANTTDAMLQIALNPGRNVDTLFGLAPATAAFGGGLSKMPNDFSLSITYTGGGLVQPGMLAVDYGGNVYTTNCATCVNASGTDSLVGFSPVGVPVTGALGFTNGIHKPTALAFDLYDNLWSTNLATGATPDQVNRTDSSGNELNNFPFSNSISGPSGIAIDRNYNAWVSNQTNSTVVQVTGPGSLGPVVSASGFTAPTGVGIDGFGNIYASGGGSSSILKFNLSGTVLSSGYTGAGIRNPLGVTIDGGQHVWSVGAGANSVSEIFGYDGTADSSASGYTGGIYTATTVSIDGAGTAWLANCRASCAGSGSTAADNLLHLSATGVVLNAPTGTSTTYDDGYQADGLNQPSQSIIDPAGNLWISNVAGGSLTEMVGIAVPVVPNLTYQASANLLPSANLLLNPGFELAGTGNYVPDWTLSTGDGNPYESYTEGGGHSGNNRLTEYNGSSIQATESQTVAAANGNYLVSCWVQGGGGQTTAQLIASGYNSAGSSMTQDVIAVTTANKYNWNLVSIPNVPVSNGSLTVGLYNDTPGGGAYLSWDDCSATRQ